MMQRSKTDKIDSKIILEYLLRMNFKKWILPDSKILQIQAIARRLYQLKKQLVTERNRHAANNYKVNSACKVVNDSLKGTIKYLQKNIDKLQENLLQMIKSIPELAEKYKILTSVKGIGDISACQMLSEIILMPDDLEPKQLVAFAGLDPKVVESGSSVNKKRKISKKGNKFLRASLHMPILTAIQHNKHIKAYYEKLVSAGKEKMCAVIAATRKLLLAIWGMLKSGKIWDGEKFYKLSENNT